MNFEKINHLSPTFDSKYILEPSRRSKAKVNHGGTRLALVTQSDAIRQPASRLPDTPGQWQEGENGFREGLCNMKLPHKLRSNLSCHKNRHSSQVV